MIHEYILATLTFVVPVVITNVVSIRTSVRHTRTLISSTVMILVQERLIEMYERLSHESSISRTQYTSWAKLYYMLKTIAGDDIDMSITRMNDSITRKDVK